MLCAVDMYMGVNNIIMCSVSAGNIGDKMVLLWGHMDKPTSLGTVSNIWGQLAPMKDW